MMLVLVEVVKSIKSVMVKSLKIIAACLFLFIGYSSKAQVSIDIDENINQDLRMKNGKIDSTRIVGYRIQIETNSNSGVTNAAKNKFRRLFPEYTDRIYDLYQQPNWKVRVGDFYREIDAQELLKEIREYFPAAFLVKDKIRRPLIK
jgi:hypothetical protein